MQAFLLSPLARIAVYAVLVLAAAGGAKPTQPALAQAVQLVQGEQLLARQRLECGE